MSWTSPTSHNDVSSVWTDDANAYDGNTGTFAYAAAQGYLELLIDEIYCSRIEIWSALYRGLVFDEIDATLVDIDIYYDSAWHHVWNASITKGEYIVINIPAGVVKVTKARIKYNTPLGFGERFRIYDFKFWKSVTNLVDTNTLIRNYLLTSSILTDPLIALLGSRLYCPRLPEKATLPAISYFTRGGVADAEVPSIFSPSVQFDCWASNSIDAREVYRALYDALAGLDSEAITIAGTLYYIMKAREEVQGQDLVDTEIPNYFRVLTFYSITIRDTS